MMADVARRPSTRVATASRRSASTSRPCPKPRCSRTECTSTCRSAPTSRRPPCARSSLAVQREIGSGTQGPRGSDNQPRRQRVLCELDALEDLIDTCLGLLGGDSPSIAAHTLRGCVSPRSPMPLPAGCGATNAAAVRRGQTSRAPSPRPLWRPSSWPSAGSARTGRRSGECDAQHEHHEEDEDEDAEHGGHAIGATAEERGELTEVGMPVTETDGSPFEP